MPKTLRQIAPVALYWVGTALDTTQTAPSARAAALGAPAVNAAVECKLLAERKAGGMLAAPKKTNQHGAGNIALPALDELGISKIQSHRWQRIAAVPNDAFEKHIASFRDSTKELTTLQSALHVVMIQS